MFSKNLLFFLKKNSILSYLLVRKYLYSKMHKKIFATLTTTHLNADTASWTQGSHPCHPPQPQLQSCTLCNSRKNTNNAQPKDFYFSLVMWHCNVCFYRQLDKNQCDGFIPHFQKN